MALSKSARSYSELLLRGWGPRLPLTWTASLAAGKGFSVAVEAGFGWIEYLGGSARRS